MVANHRDGGESSLVITTLLASQTRDCFDYWCESHCDTLGRAASDLLPEVSALQTCWPTADCSSSREWDRHGQHQITGLTETGRFRGRNIAEPS